MHHKRSILSFAIAGICHYWVRYNAWLAPQTPKELKND